MSIEIEEAKLTEGMEEAFEEWKSVQDLESMSIRDVYECAFRHGAEFMGALIK